MRGKFILIPLLVAVLVSGLILTGCPKASVSEQPKVEWVLQFYSMSAKDEPAAGIISSMVPPAVEERTNGNFILKVYWGGELGISTGNYPQALSGGALDIAWTCPAYYVGEMPLMGMSAIPMGYTSMEQFREYAHEVLYDLNAEGYERAYEGKVTFLGSQPYNWSELVTKKSIADIMNWGGIKIRVSDKTSGKWVELMGGVPVVTTWGEMTPALQQGVVNGALTAFESMTKANLYELCNEVYLFHPWAGESHIIASTGSLNALPEEYKNILIEELNKANKACWDKYMGGNEAQREAIEVWRQNGATIHELSDTELKAVQEKSMGIWEQWVIDDLSRTAYEGLKELLARS